MRRLLMLTAASVGLSACAQLPPCQDAQCVAVRQQYFQNLMAIQQQNAAFQQQNLLNTQNNLAAIAASNRITTCTASFGVVRCY